MAEADDANARKGVELSCGSGRREGEWLEVSAVVEPQHSIGHFGRAAELKME